MPSLFRFLFITGTLFGIGYGTMYVLAEWMEPPQREVSQQLPTVKVRR